MTRIEDHALVGDCQSAALVCLDGTIDWLCLPRFDSPACFAALLGTTENGSWRIAPSGPVSGITRRYRGDTVVLETLFETPDGTIALLDFMTDSTLVRIVEGRRGGVRCAFDLVPAFDYGHAASDVTVLDCGPLDGDALGGRHAVRAALGARQWTAHADIPLRVQDRRVAADFVVTAGQRIRFSLSQGPPPPDLDAALAEAESSWSTWSDRSTYRGRWRAPVRRSLLTLRALMYRPSGAMVAAPTTSLPEAIGGTRNWDYRFCWPRDASVAFLALAAAGHTEELAGWSDWLQRAIGETPTFPRALYGVGGEPLIAEQEVSSLTGYEASRPVRVGNAAIAQCQLDVFGEIEMALHRAVTSGAVAPGAHWGLRRTLVEYLETVWREPDQGIWEVRGGAQQFTFSKAMVWAAFDRAIQSAEAHALPAPLDRWRRVRAEIFDMVCQQGYNPAIGAFTQTLGGTTLDASLLLLPLIGFLQPDDPRIAGTVAAIGLDLMADGLIKRYHTHETADGLPPGEGVFLACSFWYASNLALLGRRDEAVALFERLLGLCNDVGLLAEEYDPINHRQLGNFPQAFSHLSLIGTALVLDGVTTGL